MAEAESTALRREMAQCQQRDHNARGHTDKLRKEQQFVGCTFKRLPGELAWLVRV